MTSRAELIEKIGTMGLPIIMTGIWFGARFPPRFAAHYSVPNRFLLNWSRLASRDPAYSLYIPLIEPSGDDAIYAFSAGVYLERYFDDRAPTIIGPYFNQLTAFIFADMADSGIEDDAIEAAASLEFPYVEEYLAYCSDSGAGNSLVVRRRFVDLVGSLERARLGKQ